jgi:hypothetical protein
MKSIRLAFLSCCLCLSLAACSNTHQGTEPSASNPAGIPATIENDPTLTPTYLSAGETLLMILPRCDGIEILEDPIQFKWPNIEDRIKELEGSLWGYYSCPEPQKVVAAFYREQMAKSRPTIYYEANWVERSEGTVGVYYDGVNWTYLWVVPQPDNAQKSYVIVAQSNGPVIGDCIAASPPINNDVFTDGEIKCRIE